MNKPYTIIFNSKGKAIVTIDNSVVDEESKMVQRFIDDGCIVKDITEDEYKTIFESGNFNPF